MSQTVEERTTLHYAASLLFPCAFLYMLAACSVTKTRTPDEVTGGHEPDLPFLDLALSDSELRLTNGELDGIGVDRGAGDLDQPDVCVPSCDGKECGDDDCEGTCGGCAEFEVCTLDGLCACAPSCDSKECGNDGCGGNCGECPELWECTNAKLCACAFQSCNGACCAEDDVCAVFGCCLPDSSQYPCGNDGCGFPCTPCGKGYECSVEAGAGVCEPFCDDLCDGFECGTAGLEDECDCGSCDDGNQCTQDQCTDEHLCVNVSADIACNDGSLCTLADQCVDAQCVGGPEPDCDDGKECTTDSCLPLGGCWHVLACPTADICSESGVCCTPAVCGEPGYECGAFPNACDGAVECGGCPEGETCDTGACGDGTCDIASFSRFGGWVTNVAVEGEHAYVGMGSDGLSVFDISNDEPILVGKVGLAGWTKHIFVEDDLALVSCKDNNLPGDETALHIVDVTVPGQPTVIGSYSGPSDIKSSFVAGDLALVAGWFEGLFIVDISDPANPTTIGTYDTPGRVTAIEVDAGFAFVADFYSGVHVLDVIDPTEPVHLASVEWDGYAYDLQLFQGYLFVTVLLPQDWQELAVLDVTDPFDPQEVASLQWQGAGGKLELLDGLAYVASTGDTGNCVTVVDISNPLAPEVSNVLDTFTTAAGVAPDTDRLFVADGGAGLVVLAMDGAFVVDTLAHYDVLGGTRGIALKWPFAYISEHDQMHVVDISNSDEPEMLGAMLTPAYNGQIQVSGDYAYMLNSTEGLMIIDVSDEMVPTIVAQVPLEKTIHLALNGSLAHVAGGQYPFWEPYLATIDMSEPTAPTILSTFVLPEVPRDLDVDQVDAYVVCEDGGLVVLDIGDPYAPVSVANVHWPSSMFAIDVQGNHGYVLYANMWEHGMLIYDLVEPESPHLVVQFHFDEIEIIGPASELQLVGNTAFIFGGGTTEANKHTMMVQVLDVSVPTDPLTVAVLETATATFSIDKERHELLGGKMYSALGGPGLGVFDLSGCW